MFKRRSPDLRLVVKVVSTSLAIAALGCSDQGSIASNQAAIDDATASDEEALEKSRVRAAYIAARQAEALEEPGYHVDLWRNPERPANADRRLVARNPQQRFTSTFGDEGVRIGFAKENWELRFRVVGIACRAGEETPVREVGEPFWSDSNRVEYNRRAGEIRLREWYVNGPLGLEHGVTLPEPPCNGKALGTREIVIAVQMEELSARRAVRDGEPECVELIDDTGEVRLQYSDLYSVDATGKALQARMVAAASNRVEFVVSVEGATYPVVVDPLVWAGERKLIASDGRASDRFGFSASLTADRALVGAYGDEFSRGSAYVLSKSGTSWSEEQKLTASDGAAGDEFGRSVSLTADRALVGVYGGSAYVFSRSGTTWTEEQKLAASDGAAGDQFGCAVSLTADRALVGARGHDSSHGSVYVFSRSGTTWTEEQKLTASDGAAGDQFGCAVSLTADRALVGAYGDEVERGSVYVFSRSGTTWTEEQKLTASDGATRDVFGWSVSLTADRALVGAWGDDSSSGSAYVFSRSDTAWSEEKKLTAGDGAANTYFGSSVSLTADRALVGAHGDDSNRGSAYVFSRSGTAWSEEKKLTASDGTASDYFGSSVSLTTDRALVGATDDLSRRGSAYIYSLLSADGDPCTGDVGCLNGRCVDGVCCNVSCTGSCAACSAATGAATDGICKTFAAGSPGSPTCGTLACNGTDLDCAACATDTHCTATTYCASDGTCQPRHTPGSACNLAKDCAVSGCRECVAGATCKDGYCCGSACDGVCQTCAATPGTCSSVKGADDQDTCTGTNTCDAGGSCKLSNGQSCGGGSTTCASGLCADGLCCNTACSEGCDRCDATPGTCTPSGAGNPGASPSCGTYVCGLSAACPTSCGYDADCATGFYCSANGACIEQKTQGTTCDDASGGDCRINRCRVCEAGEGTCVNGFCCNSTCSGACDACDGGVRGWSGTVNGTCALAPSGFLGEPLCGAFSCTGSDASCVGDSCDADADCSSQYYCAANNNCQPRKQLGDFCDDNAGADCEVAGCRVCTTGHCSDGMCCDAACSGGCDVCKQSLGASTDGECTVLLDAVTGTGCGAYLCDGSTGSCPASGSCSDDDDCTAGNFCSSGGNCGALKGKGQSCTESRECEPPNTSSTGFCVDGVCCDEACTDDCSACRAALKQSGVDDGTCGAAKLGTDPHDSCETEPQSTCGHTGNCDAGGECQFWPENTSCSDDTFCSAGNVTGKVCTGERVCTSVTNQPCSPYICQNDGCTSPCTSSAQCEADYYCVGGTCVRRQSDGRACTLGEECDSGFCVDGVCCDAPCGGQCEACALSGKLGRCAAVEGMPIAPRSSCAGAPPCNGTCNGGDRTACAYPDDATSCGEATCMGDVLGLDPRCDGAGECSAPRTQACDPYTCDATSLECHATCTTDRDCASGARCETTSGRCTHEGDHCSDSFTVETPIGTQTSCVPYKCRSGACRETCDDNTDCADGYLCQASLCIQDPPTGGEGGADAGVDLPGTGAGAGGETGETDAGTLRPRGASPKQNGGCGCAVPREATWDLRALILATAVALGLARRRRMRGRRDRTGTHPARVTYRE